MNIYNTDKNIITNIIIPNYIYEQNMQKDQYEGFMYRIIFDKSFNVDTVSIDNVLIPRALIE